LQPHEDQQIEHDHKEHDDQLHSFADDHGSIVATGRRGRQPNPPGLWRVCRLAEGFAPRVVRPGSGYDVRELLAAAAVDGSLERLEPDVEEDEDDALALPGAAMRELPSK
jgi:hypothetical protein